MSFYLIWKKGDTLLRGFDVSRSLWVDGSLAFPVSFPGKTTPASLITLRSSAMEGQTFETLANIKLYLTGADIATVQSSWPYLGAGFTPVRNELNGGFEISFDDGRSYTRFDNTHGLESNSSTWITVPASAIGLNGLDGRLGPFDMARFTVRYVIPPGANLYKKFDIRLSADFDIV